jgi:NitT/TauT family transport system substrate-binding protein
MARRKGIRIAGFVAAITVLVTACGGAGGSDDAAPIGAGNEFGFNLEGRPLRVGLTQPSVLQIPSYYARDLLAGWGADVETQVLGRTTGVEAILAGQLDVAARSQEEALRGADSGADLTAIGSWLTSMPYVLVTREDIASVADLRGRNVAIGGPATFDNLMFRYLLEGAGLDPDADVTFTPLGAPPDRTAAMLAGRVDAALLFIDGWISIEEQADDLNNHGPVRDMLPEPGLDNGFWYGSREYLDSSGDMALAIACANLESHAWAAQNRDEFIRYTLDNVEGALEEDVAAAYDEAQRLQMWPTDPGALLRMDRITNLVGILADHGVVREGMDPATIVNAEYLEAAAARGCGA